MIYPPLLRLNFGKVALFGKNLVGHHLSNLCGKIFGVCEEGLFGEATYDEVCQTLCRLLVYLFCDIDKLFFV